MTKAWPAAAALLLLLAVPAATAHGAPGPRAIDTRVAVDDDGALGYGAGAGLDLLALDVREAHLPTGEPAVVFRVLLQSDAPAGSAFTLRVATPAGTHEFGAATADGAAYAATGFDRLDGPFDVGDGHPKALDGWVSYSRLGVSAGDTVSGLAVESARDGARDDVMPGTWFLHGQEIPALPASEAEAPSYTLQGPARLLSLEATPGPLPNQVQLRLGNAVALDQFVDLSATAPDGVTATLDRAAVSLAADGASSVLLTLDGVADGNVTVTAVSDLGARQSVTLDAPAPPPAPAANLTAEGDGHEGHDGHAEEKESPAPAAALAGLALLAAARRLRKGQP